MSHMTLDDHVTAADAGGTEGLPRQFEAPGMTPIGHSHLVLRSLALLLLLAAGGLLLVDFRALQGAYNTDQQVTTSSSGVDAEHPLPRASMLDLYVVGPPGTTARLAGRLSEQLRNKLSISDVELRQLPLAGGTGSMLLVEVQSPSILWTPFYSRGELSLRLSYASNGAVDWIHVPAIRFDGGQAATYIRADYHVQDSAFGLMSLPGYYSYLNEQVAAGISDLLKTALTNRSP